MASTASPTPHKKHHHSTTINKILTLITPIFCWSSFNLNIIYIKKLKKQQQQNNKC